jgi:hypothetical protein
MVGLYLASRGLDARVLGLSISASADARAVARSIGVQRVSTWRALDQAVARLARS